MKAEGFFPGDHPELRVSLQNYLDWLGTEAAALHDCKALLLGGGYGRGEGGIWRTSPAEAPRLYNDLEFYLFVPRISSDTVKHWQEEGESRFHIEMEFKVSPPDALSKARPSMFYYDLLNGHRLVHGSADWVSAQPGILTRADAIPPDEAGRLLVNRGISLLRCARWADGEISLPDGFCDRISAKLQLALADAVLCILGIYHWSCRERHARLAHLDNKDTPPVWDRLLAWHADAVSFKFAPHHQALPPQDWVGKIAELRRAWVNTFLWLESRRLGLPGLDALSYVRATTPLFPDLPKGANMLRQIRDLARPCHVPFQRGDHPRSAVWKSLVLLIDPDRPDDALAASLLGAPDLKVGPLEERCRDCWKLYP